LCTVRLKVRQRAVLHAPLIEAHPESVCYQAQALARQAPALHPARVLLGQAWHLGSVHLELVLRACVGLAKVLTAAAPRIDLVLDNA
jgi:hypothetical protein